MTHRIATLVALLALGACATGAESCAPAAQRGFFSGISAATSGCDAARSTQLQQQATAEEQRAQAASARATTAEQQAALTEGQVRAAQQRLDTLGARLRDQRATLDRLRGERAPTPEGSAEATRLQNEIAAIERDRAAAQRAGGAGAASLPRIEQRANEIDAALRRFGAT